MAGGKVRKEAEEEPMSDYTEIICSKDTRNLTMAS